jgi:hypothetical protein
MAINTENYGIFRDVIPVTAELAVFSADARLSQGPDVC